MKEYLVRLECLPITFFIIGVESLTADCKEVILKWTSFKTTCPNIPTNAKIKQAKVTLIFRTVVGLQMFDFLPKKTHQENKQNEFLNILTNQMQTQQVKSLKLATSETHATGKSENIRYYLNELKSKQIIDEWIAVSANEDFSSMIFLERCQSLIFSNKSKSKKIGIHFNVSAYAPLDVVSQFLQNFILWGFFFDAKTGEMKTSPSNANWYICVELSTAPPKDIDYSKYSTVESYLDVLFIANKLGSKSIETAPLQCRQEIAKCNRFLMAANIAPAIGDWMNIPAATMLNDIEVERFQKNLRDHCTQVLNDKSKNKLVEQVFGDYRLLNRFLKHLSDRCDFLDIKIETLKQNREAQREYNNDEASFKDACAQFDKNLGPGLITKYFHVFLIESINLCDSNISQDFSNQSPFFTARYVEHSDASFNLIDFKSKAPHIDPNIVNKILTKKIAIDRPGNLVSDLAFSFGMPGPRKVYEILEDESYLLTPEFALKLLYLNDTFKAGLNLIFNGATGLGKTELLKIFSRLLNTIDVVNEFSTFLKSQLLFTPHLKHLKQKYDQNLVEIPGILHFLEQICKLDEILLN